MARVDECRYKFCRLGTTINATFHPECRAAFCEDLLAKIKSLVNDKNNTPAQVYELVKLALDAESFQTIEEYLKQNEEREKLAGKQRLWRLMKDKHLQDASAAFDRDHPEPDPQRC